MRVFSTSNLNRVAGFPLWHIYISGILSLVANLALVGDFTVVYIIGVSRWHIISGHIVLGHIVSGGILCGWHNILWHNVLGHIVLRQSSTPPSLSEL